MKLTRQQENFIEKCFKNDLRMVKQLVKNKVDFTVSNYWGYRIASSNGFNELLNFLFSLDPNREELAKSNILAWTATSGNLETAKYLINDGSYYENDSMAIQWTASKGDIEMMELLLGYCKNFDWIMVSAAKNGKVDMVSFLLDNSIEEFDRNFNLSFNNAVVKKKKKVADLLVKLGYFNEKNVDTEIWNIYINLQ